MNFTLHTYLVRVELCMRELTQKWIDPTHEAREGAGRRGTTGRGAAPAGCAPAEPALVAARCLLLLDRYIMPALIAFRLK